jgi:multidrug efflux pump subunit AcrA (membrane-fusion protein)
MRTKAVGALFAGGVVVVAAAVAIPAINGLGREPDIPVYRVERGGFSRTVVAEGVLEAERTTPLTSPSQTRLPLTIAWLATDGTRVSKDEVVIRFDPTEMEQNLLDGQSERATAETRAQKQTVESAATVENLDRDAGLAGLELQYAREFQNKDPEIFSRAEIIESEIDEDLATRKKDHAKETRVLTEDLSQVELDLIGLERRKADLKIEQAEAGLRSLEVRAPHDGIFVLKRDWRGSTQVGQTVWPGQPLGEIPRLEVMQAKVFVLEADAGGLEEGISAEVVLEAHPLERYQATVKSVAALAKRRNPRSPVQYFEVILELESTDPERMKPGQRLQASLFLADLDDVLAVPRQAVIEEEDGDRLVYRRDGGEFRPVEVELGAAALGRVVVERGLDEGDVIALADPTRAGDSGESADDESGPNGSGEAP